MKVLMVCSNHTNGKIIIGNNYLHAQAIALRKKGVDVAVLSLDMRSIRRKRKFGSNKYVIDQIPIYVASFPCGPIFFVIELISKLGARICFNSIKKQFGIPDVIHCQFNNSIYIEGIARKYNIPIVTTEHSSNILSLKRKATHEKKAIRSYNNSAKIISVSTALKNSMEEFYDGNIAVINHMLPSYFEIGNTQKSSNFTFITVGNLLKIKNHDITVKSFKKFNDIHRDSKLFIVGTGDEKKQLESIVKELELQDSVIFWGFVDNKKLVKFFNEAHCFVLPSKYETFGVVYIEAIACGLPVIGTSYAKVNGIINNKNGIAIEEVTVANVYNAMEQIYNDYEQYDKVQMSRNITEKYGEEKIALELIHIYDKVASR